MNKMCLVLGDWSNCGHGNTEKVLVNVNKTVEQIQEAYKESCKLTGVSFNNDEDDYTGIDRDPLNSFKYRICTNPEQFDTVHDEALEILLNHGIDLLDLDYEIDDPYGFVNLWFDFVRLSIPDICFEIKGEANSSTQCINGYWNDLNVYFGYGLYSYN